jgi:hypothetical protein
MRLLSSLPGASRQSRLRAYRCAFGFEVAEKLLFACPADERLVMAKTIAAERERIAPRTRKNPA